MIAFIRSILSGKIRIRFKSPKKASFLVLEKRTGLPLVETVLAKKDSFLLDTRFLRYNEGEVFVGFRLVSLVFKYRAKGFSILDAYILACISIVNPRHVVDRSHNLNLLKYANHFEEQKFWLVQNGSWLQSVNPDVEAERFVQILGKSTFEDCQNLSICCFSENVVQILKDFGFADRHPSIRLLATGSMLANHFLYNIHPKEEKTKRYDICLSSQAVPGRIEKGDPLSERRILAYEKINEFLSVFVKSHEKSLVIATRLGCESPDWKKERVFHGKYFDDLPSVDIPDRMDSWQTYRLMVSSDVVISLYSTAGFEAVAWGKKSMICPFYHDDVFKVSAPSFARDEDIWDYWLSTPDYERFETMLLNLLESSQESFSASNEENALFLGGPKMCSTIFDQS